MRRVEGRAELARRARERESEAARRRMMKDMKRADAAMMAEAVREIESVILEDQIDPNLCGACGEDLQAQRATCWPCGHANMCNACALATWEASVSCPAHCPRCSDDLACVTLSTGRRIGF